MHERAVDGLLEKALAQASVDMSVPAINDQAVVEAADYICRCYNKAGIRLLLACLLAKLDRPELDVRKPYTEIGTEDSFSGRVYDELYVGPFATRHRLPVNNTTAFLTPVLRNHSTPLTREIRLVGTPEELYVKAVGLLVDVAEGRLDASALMVEILRRLLIVKSEQETQLAAEFAGLRQSDSAIPLSSEEVLTVVRQHLESPHAARLPVLVVAAAYEAASSRLGERVLALHAHNAADEQTGALGDVEVALVGDDSVVTAFEMKNRRVTRDDVDRVLQKIAAATPRPDNYIIITTEEIEAQVAEYARACYDKTMGTEVVILDCLGFLKYFLHIFHRLRIDFLDAYERHVRDEPAPAVRHELKLSFVALRRAAESAPRGEQ